MAKLTQKMIDKKNAAQAKALEEMSDEDIEAFEKTNGPLPKKSPPVKAYAVRGFRLGGDAGAVGIGEIISLPASDFEYLRHLGKVIAAKDAPKKEKKSK